MVDCTCDREEGHFKGIAAIKTPVFAAALLVLVTQPPCVESQELPQHVTQGHSQPLPLNTARIHLGCKTLQSGIDKKRSKQRQRMSSQKPAMQCQAKERGSINSCAPHKSRSMMLPPFLLYASTWVLFCSIAQHQMAKSSAPEPKCPVAHGLSIKDADLLEQPMPAHLSDELGVHKLVY